MSEGAGGAIRTLRVLLIASLAVPMVVYATAAWFSYRAHFHEAEERISREADVLREHAAKVFETAALLIAEVNKSLQGADDAEIRSNENSIHSELAAMIRDLPQVRDVWVVDAEGKPLVSAVHYPVPGTLDLSGRDYHSALRGDGERLYVSPLVTGRVSGTQYFNIAGWRVGPDGGFDGSIPVSVVPQYFASVYDQLFGSPLALAGLVRADGAVLVRYPLPPGNMDKLPPDSGFAHAIARAPERGVYETKSVFDGVDRLIAYRKLERFPIYVFAGRERNAVLADWLRTMGSHLLFGIPATLCLFTITLVALRRTTREEMALAQARAEMQRREAAEEALRQAQKLEAVGQLTGGVAHDFNNLLTVVSGNVELLKASLTEPKHAKALAAIERAARRGENLTRQLLSFARRQRLNPKPIDLPHRMKGLRDMLAHSLRGDIEVEIDVPEDTWPVLADPGELELAILNIAINARDAMPKGGRFRIAARNLTLQPQPETGNLSGDFVALSLADTGTGIAPEALPRVFEPFFTTKDIGKGTGLGLSQVLGFAQQSGGTATVTSAPGAGTTVMIYLPRSAAPALPASLERAVRLPGAGHATILVVEDNEEVGDINAARLERLGYHVVRAANAAEALEQVAGGTPADLLFSDIMMPGDMNGLELARAVRRHRPTLPILLTTGYSSAAQEAATEGFPILPKPVRIETFERAVRDALNSAALRSASR